MNSGDTAQELMSSPTKPTGQEEARASLCVACGRASALPADRAVALSVSAVPVSVGLTRAVFRAALSFWETAADVETAVLLLSELTTNAVIHGVPTPGSAFPIKVVVVEIDDALHVEVHDPNLGTGDGAVVGHTAGDKDEGGRGLKLVSTLASKWGEHTTASGRCIYFDLTRLDRSSSDKALRRQNVTRPTSGTVACGSGRSMAALSYRLKVTA